jgi:hypothetical protein
MVTGVMGPSWRVGRGGVSRSARLGLGGSMPLSSARHITRWVLPEQSNRAH